MTGVALALQAPALVVGLQACASCRGAGEHRTPCRCHRSTACPSHGAVPCTSCNGMGAVQCEYCGDDDGVVKTPGGLYCRRCAGEVGHG